MLTLIVGSTTYTLDDGSLAYYIGDSGWGMEPLHRLIEKGPMQNGDTDRGYRADARIGKLFFELVGESRTDLYWKRQALMSAFQPGSSMSLRFDLPAVGSAAAMTRQFNVVFAGAMDFPSNQREGFSQKTDVQLRAADPTCYDPTPNVVNFAGGGGSGFVVPIIVPLTFGSSVMDSLVTITPAGNADEYPIIRVVGPITDLVITNETYGEKLDFTGVTIGAGVTYEIDLRYGYKTVMQLPGTNRLSQLTEDSDLSSWRLRPGYNDIRAEGSAITGATQVQLTYYHRYLGV